MNAGLGLTGSKQDSSSSVRGQPIGGVFSCGVKTCGCARERNRPNASAVKLRAPLVSPSRDRPGGCGLCMWFCCVYASQGLKYLFIYGITSGSFHLCCTPRPLQVCRLRSGCAHAHTRIYPWYNHLADLSLAWPIGRDVGPRAPTCASRRPMSAMSARAIPESPTVLMLRSPFATCMRITSKTNASTVPLYHAARPVLKATHQLSGTPCSGWFQPGPTSQRRHHPRILRLRAGPFRSCQAI